MSDDREVQYEAAREALRPYETEPYGDLRLNAARAAGIALRAALAATGSGAERGDRAVPVTGDAEVSDSLPDEEGREGLRRDVLSAQRAAAQWGRTNEDAQYVSEVLARVADYLPAPAVPGEDEWANDAARCTGGRECVAAEHIHGCYAERPAPAAPGSEAGGPTSPTAVDTEGTRR